MRLGMSFSKTIAAKLLLLGCSIFIFLSLYVLAGFSLTVHIRDEARQINLAGSLRFRSFESAWLVRRILDTENAALRTSLLKELHHEIEMFDAVFEELVPDGEGLWMRAPDHEKLWHPLHRLIRKWRKDFKPQLLRVAELPEKPGKRELARYEAVLHDYVDEIHSFVESLIDDYEEKIRKHERLWLSLLLFFLVTLVPLVLLINRTVIRPIGEMRRATREVEAGNFGERIGETGDDEVGALADSFNSMTASLQHSFQKGVWFTDKLKMLHECSNELMAVFDAAELTRMLPPLAGRLVDAKYSLCITLEKEGTAKIAALSGDDTALLDRIRKEFLLPELRALWHDILMEKGITRREGLLRHPLPLILPENHPLREPFLCLPLVSRERVAGLLYLIGKENGGSFSKADEDISVSFVNTAALALNNAVMVRSIEESETKYRTLIELIPAVTYIVRFDENNSIHFLYISPQVEKMLGFSQEEWLANPDLWEMQLHPDDRERVLEELVSMEGSHLFEYRIFTFDGRILWVNDNATLIRDGSGAPSFMQGVAFDITAAKQAEEQLRFQAQLLDSVRESVVATDREGRVVYWGKGAEALYGYSPEEAMGRPIAFISASRDEEPGDRHPFQLVGESGIWSGHHLQCRKDGSSFWAETVVSLIRDSSGRPVGTIGIDRDSTYRRQMEEKLRSYNEELEKKVAERTRELEAAKVLAESASKVKSDFLANMSHELRTPLNSILGFSELLTDGLLGEITQKQRETVGHIHSSGYHLLNLINDILDLAKVESGKMELDVTTFSLRAVLLASVAMFRERAFKHGQQLHLEMAPGADRDIVADERKFKQILFNLISNAVKFAPDGGQITVKAAFARGEDLRERLPATPGLAYAAISVEDTGIGIKSEDISNLFKEFVQLESPYTKEYEGTGLGLALTRKIVELHGGSIWVESEFGRGSRFTFVIPVQGAAMLP